jgi:hypothetical protein
MPPMQIMLLILAGFIGIGVLNLVAARLRGSPAEQAARYPIQPGASAKADAIAFHRQIKRITQQCELAGGFRAISTTSVMMGGDPVSLYEAARKEDDLCTDVDDRLAELHIPDSLGRSVAIAYANALDTCRSAYLAQWSAAHSLAAALNNRGRMDDIATFRNSDADAKAQNTACYNRLSDAPASLGVTREDLEEMPASVPQQTFAYARSTAAPDSAPAVAKAPPRIQRLLNTWRKLNEQCRGGYETADGPVCTARDNAGFALERAGWCYGNDDEPESERDWQPCAMIKSGRTL